MYNIDICTYKHIINNIFMYTYRSSCPLVSETPTSDTKFYGQTNQKTPSFRRIRSKGKGVARFQRYEQQIEQKFAHPTHLTAILGWDIGYRISDLELFESEQSFRVADMSPQCIYRRQSPEHWDRVFTVFDLDSGPKLLRRMSRF